MELNPEVVATGHGKPMYGEDMKQQLNYLDKNFYKEFMPQHGRYIYEAAVADVNGVMYVRPAAYNPYKKWFIISAAAVITAITVTTLITKKRSF